MSTSTSGDLELIYETYAFDDEGVSSVVESKKVILCEVSSVGMQEWFEGGRNGLNPQLRFTVFSGDYSGEEICSFRGNRYRIYRTYTSGDSTELYVEKRKGNA